MPQEVKKRRVSTAAGAVGGAGKHVERTEEKNKPEYSATCMACGWGEGGGQRKGQMRRAVARKAGAGGGKKGAGAERVPKEGADAARASKREQGDAVTTMEWWCECPNEGARWRDGETMEESGHAVLTLPQRGALLTISGPSCGVYTVGVPQVHPKTLLKESVVACMCNPSGPERPPAP